MEPPICARHGVDARFVGRPLADEMPLEPDRAQARTALSLAEERPVLALLPGSRVGEIQRLAHDFLSAAARVVAAEPNVQIVAPMANAHARRAFEAILARHPDAASLATALTVIDGQARTLMRASNVILLASGTATLEAMLAKRAMVVAYKIAPLTYALVKGLGMLKVDHYSLPNVLAGERVVPELMQRDCTPDKLAAKTLALLRDPAAEAALVDRFRGLHVQLRQDASARAADAVAELIATQTAGTP